MNNKYLILAGLLSCLASLTHLAIIVGGPDWYRFFGAGEAMAMMAEQGLIQPTLITLFIAAVLFAWGLYAFLGAGLLPRFPFLKFCLVAITSVYLIRGFAGLIILFFPESSYVKELGVSFLFWSSLICCLYGMVHVIGLSKAWSKL
jgi:hypothetical protein